MVIDKIGFVSPERRYERGERLYFRSQFKTIMGKDIGLLRFPSSGRQVIDSCSTLSLSSYICVDRYVSVCNNHQMVENSMYYVRLGHTWAVREEMLFRRLPHSITHSPYTEGRCSWGRINDADYNASAVAIFGQNSRLPI